MDFDEKNNNGDFVMFMFVYFVKGLEFKVIYVVGLEENFFFFFMVLDSKDGFDEER